MELNNKDGSLSSILVKKKPLSSVIRKRAEVEARTKINMSSAGLNTLFNDTAPSRIMGTPSMTPLELIAAAEIWGFLPAVVNDKDIFLKLIKESIDSSSGSVNDVISFPGFIILLGKLAVHLMADPELVELSPEEAGTTILVFLNQTTAFDEFIPINTRRDEIRTCVQALNKRRQDMEDAINKKLAEIYTLADTSNNNNNVLPEFVEQQQEAEEVVVEEEIKISQVEIKEQEEEKEYSFKKRSTSGLSNSAILRKKPAEEIISTFPSSPDESPYSSPHSRGNAELSDSPKRFSPNLLRRHSSADVPPTPRFPNDGLFGTTLANNNSSSLEVNNGINNNNNNNNNSIGSRSSNRTTVTANNTSRVAVDLSLSRFDILPPVSPTPTTTEILTSDIVVNQLPIVQKSSLPLQNPNLTESFIDIDNFHDVVDGDDEEEEQQKLEEAMDNIDQIIIHNEEYPTRMEVLNDNNNNNNIDEMKQQQQQEEEQDFVVEFLIQDEKLKTNQLRDAANEIAGLVAEKSNILKHSPSLLVRNSSPKSTTRVFKKSTEGFIERQPFLESSSSVLLSNEPVKIETINVLPSTRKSNVFEIITPKASNQHHHRHHVNNGKINPIPTSSNSKLDPKIVENTQRSIREYTEQQSLARQQREKLKPQSTSTISATSHKLLWRQLINSVSTLYDTYGTNSETATFGQFKEILENMGIRCTPPFFSKLFQKLITYHRLEGTRDESITEDGKQQVEKVQFLQFLKDTLFTIELNNNNHISKEDDETLYTEFRKLFLARKYSYNDNIPTTPNNNGNGPSSSSRRGRVDHHLPTFHPKITEKSRAIDKTLSAGFAQQEGGNNITRREELMEIRYKQSAAKQEQLRKEFERNRMKECTFRPKVNSNNKGSTIATTSSEIATAAAAEKQSRFDALYADHLNRLAKKQLSQEIMENKRRQEELIEKQHYLLKTTPKRDQSGRVIPEPFVIRTDIRGEMFETFPVIHTNISPNPKPREVLMIAEIAISRDKLIRIPIKAGDSPAHVARRIAIEYKLDDHKRQKLTRKLSQHLLSL